MKRIFGNWKMHGSQDFVQAFCKDLSETSFNSEKVEAVVFPTFLHIPMVVEALRRTKIQVGGQDAAPAPKEGAFTGAISALMLKEFGCNHVLVGHSERRSIFLESDTLVAQKVLAVLTAGLTPVLCVGETLEQREQGHTFQVIEQQLNQVHALISKEQLAALVIAYEPVWAIGTGRSATIEQVEEVHAHIRTWLTQHATSQLSPILYGGSVNAQNAAQFLSSSYVDGALIGGASIKIQEFRHILQLAGEV